MRFKVSFYAIVEKLAWDARLSTSEASDPEELAIETERAGFRGAPEEAEMAEAPFCEHLSDAPIHRELW